MKKIALVTGGSTGIGSSISTKLACESGLHVIINYNQNDSRAVNLMNVILEKGGSAECLKFDVRNREETEYALENWSRKNNNAFIHTVVNNAGIVKDGLFIFMEQPDWDEVLDTKLSGFYNVTRWTLKNMLLKREGRIITISSLIGLNGQAGQVNYAAANGGLIAATKALAKEVAKRKITVNAVTPGFIQTEMTEKLPIDELLKYIPAGRFGLPDEVADLVCFLASEKSSYINGETITISGGL